VLGAKCWTMRGEARPEWAAQLVWAQPRSVVELAGRNWSALRVRKRPQSEIRRWRRSICAC